MEPLLLFGGCSGVSPFPAHHPPLLPDLPASNPSVEMTCPLLEVVSSMVLHGYVRGTCAAAVVVAVVAVVAVVVGGRSFVLELLHGTAERSV